VPDQRGYGGSSRPHAIRAYHIRELTADVVGLAAALGESRFNVIGHDWGCVVAWATALLHPAHCHSVMGLSVPFWAATDAMFDPPGHDDRFWYWRYFDAEGVAEAELERDLEQSLLTIYYALAADSPLGSWMHQLEHPAGVGLLDALPRPSGLPRWLTREDFDYYLAQYRKSGFRGPNNWYRNLRYNNVVAPELVTGRITPPAAFAAGSLDDVLMFDPAWHENFPRAFDDLRFIELVDGAGHWLQVERPAETSALMLRFLREVAPRAAR